MWGKKNFLLTFAKSFEGSIQWVGKSLLRPNHKRKNWFIGVSIILPPKLETWESSKDFKVETMRASGPGRQHVNKVESAIRVTHLPTGLSIIAQEERSQHLNKKLAYGRIKYLLDQREMDQKKAVDRDLWANHNKLERGNTIRVYVGEFFR